VEIFGERILLTLNAGVKKLTWMFCRHVEGIEQRKIKSTNRNFELAEVEFNIARQNS
jgi:hypothetical protein